MTPPVGKTHVIVAMSGGVDSSVAAARLLEQGYSVAGLFMKNWEEDDSERGDCPASVDLADAQAVCGQLGIELHTVNFAAEYWERVFERMLAGLRRGSTPNPDILCNREIKFREFIEWARELGADRVATGHYARRDAGGRMLLRARDGDKDQSYFLHAIDGRVLPSVLFPVGEMRKGEVRARARELGLVTHDKRDSTGICFIGERRFGEFISRYVDTRAGDIVDEHGRVVGRHRGLAAYTLGQRHGLGIGGAGDPWYVAAKDLAGNRLVVVQGHDHPRLFSDVAELTPTSWIAGRPPAVPMPCTARARYRQRDQQCVLEHAGPGRARVRFLTPQRALTPGQSVVLYDGEICLGGGVIDRARRSGTATGEKQPRELASA